MKYWLKNSVAEQEVLRKLQKAGMTFITWSPEEIKKLEKARINVMKNKFAKQSPVFAKKLESQLEFLTNLGYELPN